MAAVDDVRLLITDVDPDAQLFTDDQLSTFLRLSGGGEERWTVRRAAAEALDTIAVSEVLVGKVIRSQDLSTDGAKVSAELRARAAALRQRADREEDQDDEERSGGVEVIEFSPWRVP